jgi:hypothetical protein
MKVTTHHNIKGVKVTITGKEWTEDRYVGKHYAFIRTKEDDSKGGEEDTPKTAS